MVAGIFNLIKLHLPLIEATLLSLLLGFLSSRLFYQAIKKYYTPHTITPTNVILAACQIELQSAILDY
jgi:hypothetical protein